MSAGQLPVAGPAAVRRAAGRIIAADRYSFAVVVVVNALAAAAGLLAPWLVGQLVNAVVAGSPVATIDRLGMLLLAAAVGQFVLGWAGAFAAQRFGERTAARLRERLTDQLMRLPARVVERAGVGDLTSRATTDAGLVAMALRDAGPEVLFALVQTVIIVVAVVALSPVLGGVGLLALLAIPVALRWYLRRARPAYLREGAARAEVAEVVASSTSGARTVELLGLRRRRREARVAAVDEATATQRATLRLRSGLFPTIDVASELAVAAVFCVGGLLHLSGSLSLGAVVAATLYLRQLRQPIDTLLVWVDTLQSSFASFARVEGVGDDAPARPPSTAAAPRDERIQLRDVHYAYDGDDVLHGIDLDVRPGEHLALVGRSGAGKTTLARLVAGLDRPREGTALVGGSVIADLTPEQLREHVLLVTQEQHVFAESLRDNLTLASPTATDVELVATMSAVGAGWWDELPDGLDTDLGEHRISGAQAQQVALARVLLADPHTVVLDEATAQLDPARARRSERTLAVALAGRTVISVAHRLHTARDADRIAVMERGRITELGSHDELIAADGDYAALWRAWTGESGPSSQR